MPESSPEFRGKGGVADGMFVGPPPGCVTVGGTYETSWGAMGGAFVVNSCGTVGDMLAGSSDNSARMMGFIRRPKRASNPITQSKRLAITDKDSDNSANFAL